MPIQLWGLTALECTEPFQGNDSPSSHRLEIPLFVIS